MKFPKAIDDIKDEQQRASARLTYICRKMALEYGLNPTVRAFARLIDLDHSTIHIYIGRGYFSDRAAIKAEEVFGRTVLSNEWLRKPLEIGTAE